MRFDQTVFFFFAVEFLAVEFDLPRVEFLTYLEIFALSPPTATTAELFDLTNLVDFAGASFRGAVFAAESVKYPFGRAFLH